MHKVTVDKMSLRNHEPTDPKPDESTFVRHTPSARLFRKRPLTLDKFLGLDCSNFDVYF